VTEYILEDGPGKDGFIPENDQRMQKACLKADEDPSPGPFLKKGAGEGEKTD
jgi:hypothetical protein